MNKKIRTNLAKALIPCGIAGDAIDIMTGEVEKDVAWPGFAITRMDVANMTVKYRPEREDVVIYAGRRDWQFREDGSMIGAGYGFGCCCLKEVAGADSGQAPSLPEVSRPAECK